MSLHTDSGTLSVADGNVMSHHGRLSVCSVERDWRYVKSERSTSVERWGERSASSQVKMRSDSHR